MPRKISRPDNVRTETYQYDGNDWGRLVHRISNGEYVLVIGSEIVLSKSLYPQFNGNSKKLLLEESVRGLIEDRRLGEDYSCKSFSELESDVPSIHKKVAAIINQRFEFSSEDASEDLKTLLKTRCFRVVLTTTFDPIVEMVMREVWGDIRVMNIYESIGQNSDFQPMEHNVTEYYDTQPTLFYVFGKMGNDRKYVLTDNDAIEVIEKWLKPEVQKRFKTYISQKRVLAVGCKLDDWLFRFFWYAIQQDIANLGKGEVAITLDPKPGSSDESLQQYLERNEVKTYQDAHNFIGELNSRLTDINNRFVDINLRKQKGGIFISYANEDLAIVSQIFNRLVKEGFIVWLDNEKLGAGNSDDYNQRIEQAIAECKVFVPVFSSQTKKDFIAGTPRYYRDTEWRLAVNALHRPYIKPIQLNGYNYRADYHKAVCADFERIGNATIFDLYSEPFENYVKGLAGLLNEL